jgi:hypothetical protein
LQLRHLGHFHALRQANTNRAADDHRHQDPRHVAGTVLVGFNSYLYHEPGMEPILVNIHLTEVFLGIFIGPPGAQTTPPAPPGSACDG